MLPGAATLITEERLHVVMQAFNLSTGDAGSEFKASLFYRMSSRTSRTTQRDHVPKDQTKQTPRKDYMNMAQMVQLGIMKDRLVFLIINPWDG